MAMVFQIQGKQFKKQEVGAPLGSKSYGLGGWDAGTGLKLTGQI